MLHLSSGYVISEPHLNMNDVVQDVPSIHQRWTAVDGCVVVRRSRTNYDGNGDECYYLPPKPVDVLSSFPQSLQMSDFSRALICVE